jgi:FtsP/CotA-like multicopper oxidase with cupredoxin domain
VRRWNAVVIGAVLALTFLPLPSRAAAEPRIFELSIRNGELPVERRVVRVRQGDDVTLRWTTNKALSIHLHGYDIEMPLSPAAPVSMRFTARASGRFPIEIHAHGRGGKRVLAHVEVHPR